MASQAVATPTPVQNQDAADSCRWLHPGDVARMATCTAIQ